MEVAGLSICRVLDYGTDCSWWGSALTPANLSPPPHNHTQKEREKEREMERVLGEWWQVKETQDELLRGRGRSRCDTFVCLLCISADRHISEQFSHLHPIHLAFNIFL